MVEITNLKELIMDTIRREAAEKKQADLAHAMNMRVLHRKAGYEQQDNRAYAQANRLKEAVSQAKIEWNRGYNNDMVASLYSMLALCEEIGLLVREWGPIGQILREFETGGSFPLPITDMIHRKIDEYLYNNPPEKALPRLRFHAEMDVNGKLDFSSLKDMSRSDGSPMFRPIKLDPEQSKEEQEDNAQRQLQLNQLQAGLESHLRDGVKAWLDGLGYEPEKKANAAGVLVETGVFLDKQDHHTQLTPQKFKEYRDNEAHPERSFEAFLKRTFEGVDFEQEAYTSMRP